MEFKNFDSVNTGKRIESLRKAKGFTQEQMGSLMNMKRETYNTIEKGKRALKDSEIILMADILETSCDYLLKGVDVENRSLFKDIHLSNTALNQLIAWSKQATEENEDGIPAWFMPGIQDDFPVATILDGLDYLITHESGNQLLLMLAQYMLIDFRVGTIKLPDGYALIHYEEKADGPAPDKKLLFGVTASDEATISVDKLKFSSLFSGKSIELSVDTFENAVLQEIIDAIKHVKIIRSGGTKINNNFDMSKKGSEDIE